MTGWGIVVLLIVIATIVALILLWAFPSVGSRVKFCPGCGRRLERWNEYVTDGGEDITREWYGCPNYNLAPYAEKRRHYARWTRTVRSSAFDPATGKPRS